MTAGGGVTYPRVVNLLKAEVAKKGQRAAARDIGIALLSIQRYIKGIGEPSQSTLEKLADYFEKPVAWLRGDTQTIAEGLHSVVKSIMEHYEKVRPELSHEEREKAGYEMFVHMNEAVAKVMKEDLKMDKQEVAKISEFILTSPIFEAALRDTDLESDYDDIPSETVADQQR